MANYTFETITDAQALTFSATDTLTFTTAGLTANQINVAFRGAAKLPRAGFRHDAALAHAPGEQRLAHRVIDLVRASVGEIFALQENPHTALRRVHRRFR